MKDNLKGVFLILLGILLVIIAFIADQRNIVISDLLVPVYWITVLILIVSGLYLLFFKRNENR